MGTQSNSRARGCILFVSPGASIVNPASAEGTRLKHLSQQLSKTWDICVLVPSDVGRGATEWIDTVYTYDQWEHPFLTDLNPSFITTMGRVLQRENVDIVHASKGICSTKMLTKLLRSDTALVYAGQNVEAAHARDFVDETLPFSKQVLGPGLIPLIERMTVACADRLTTVSKNDKRSFMDRYDVDSERIAAVPTGTTNIDEDELPSPVTVRERYDLSGDTVAVFHGSYSHPPNREAVNLIQEQIAPAVRERELDIVFLLVGKGIPEADASNVRSVGFVEDLFTVLQVADVALVPVRHGGGTKTKVFDYISLGLPMVATKKAVDGIELESGTHGLFTESVDAEFLSALSSLVGDDALQAEIRANLLDLADEWTWERSAERLEAFYQGLHVDGP